MRHYFPSVDLESLDDETFAMYVNDAEWLHVQQSIAMQQNTLGVMGAAFGGGTKGTGKGRKR